MSGLALAALQLTAGIVFVVTGADKLLFRGRSASRAAPSYADAKLTALAVTVLAACETVAGAALLAGVAARPAAAALTVLAVGFTGLVVLSPGSTTCGCGRPLEGLSRTRHIWANVALASAVACLWIFAPPLQLAHYVRTLGPGWAGGAAAGLAIVATTAWLRTRRRLALRLVIGLYKAASLHDSRAVFRVGQ